MVTLRRVFRAPLFKASLLGRRLRVAMRRKFATVLPLALPPAATGLGMLRGALLRHCVRVARVVKDATLR